MTDDKPRYKHDCDSCTFLGTRLNHDLYFCGDPQGDDTGISLIARYSDDGPDYKSSCLSTIRFTRGGGYHVDADLDECRHRFNQLHG